MHLDFDCPIPRNAYCITTSWPAGGAKGRRRELAGRAAAALIGVACMIPSRGLRVFAVGTFAHTVSRRGQSWFSDAGESLTRRGQHPRITANARD